MMESNNTPPAAPVTHNPHTGTLRDPRDVASDPQAVLCVEPAAPLHAAKPSAAPASPAILEALSYHARERDDLTLEDAVTVIRSGWRTVSGRSERALVLQIAALLAAAPHTSAAAPDAQPETTDDGFNAPPIGRMADWTMPKLYDLCCRQAHRIREAGKCIGRYQAALDDANAKEAAAQPEAKAAPVSANAIPSGWRMKQHEGGVIAVQKDGLGGYTSSADDDNIASSILHALASDILAAPAPATLSEDAAEGLEILDQLIDSISKHGNYSQEATLIMLGQLRQCVATAGNGQELEGWKPMPLALTEPMREVLTTMLTNCHSVDESYSDLLAATPAPSATKAATPITEWQEGVLMAASVLIACHDQPTMAGSILHELGVRDADCSQMDDFDKANLQKIELKGIALRGLDDAPVGGA